VERIPYQPPQPDRLYPELDEEFFFQLPYVDDKEHEEEFSDPLVPWEEYSLIDPFPFAHYLVDETRPRPPWDDPPS